MYKDLHSSDQIRLFINCNYKKFEYIFINAAVKRYKSVIIIEIVRVYYTKLIN